MADPQLTEILGRCERSDEGCFAGDQEAIESMLWVDDAMIRSGQQRIAMAADDAASEGLPLVEATFVEPSLDIVGQLWDNPFTPPHKRGVVAEIGQGDTRTIGELLEDEPDSIRARIAKCAYSCGRVGVGDCPIKTPQQ
jgi:hypothetical protein